MDNQCWSNSNSISVAAKTNYTAIINATFYASATPTGEDFSILVSNTNIDSAASNLNVSGTLITSQAGPYLTQQIVTYPSSVYLTEENISLDGYIQNVMGGSVPNASNTAYNVSFNWTLPSETEFINISGNLSQFYENITDSNYHYSTINLNFVDLEVMTPGTKIFALTTTGFNYTNGNILDANGNSVLNSSVSVTFLCYNVSDGTCVTACGHAQDPDCTETAGTTTTTITTSGGGGGGGGGGSVRTEATFELQRGEASTFELEIKNKYPGTMKNIKIAVSGINSEYILINPSTIDSIAGYQSKKIKVKINAPAYFTGKKYILNFLIEGEIDTNGISTPLSETKHVTLYILEVSREQSDVYLNEIQNFIQEMNASGMNLKSINALLNSMNKNYIEFNFADVRNIYDEAKQMYNDALEAKSILEEMKISVADAEKRGITATETKKMLYIGQAAFNRGDYSLAIERLKEAKLTFALETKGEFNLAYAIKNNPLEFLGILLGLSLVGTGSALFIRFQLYKKKLRALKEEEILLLELMKIIQKECFERNHMSMEEYENAMVQYENRLSETIEDRIRIETKIENMLKFKGKRKALDEEKKRLVVNLKKIQDDYLNKGRLETRVYENMVKSYTRRLTEVEEEMATMEAEEAIKREKKVKRMFKVKG